MALVQLLVYVLLGTLAACILLLSPLFWVAFRVAGSPS